MRVELMCHKNTLVVVRQLVKYSDAGVRDVAPKAFPNIHVLLDDTLLLNWLNTLLSLDGRA